MDASGRQGMSQLRQIPLNGSSVGADQMSPSLERRKMVLARYS
jgi:hypothetical protein